MPNQYYMPLANKMAPAKKVRMNLMEQQYANYIATVEKAILRQGSKEMHKEIKYLESMLLYLTQECKQTFKSLIKCDYLTESWYIQLMADQKDKVK